MPRSNRSQDQATLYIDDADELTKLQRQRVANWLTSQAKLLVRDGKEYSRYYHAHYIKER